MRMKRKSILFCVSVLCILCLCSSCQNKTETNSKAPQKLASFESTVPLRRHNWSGSLEDNFALLTSLLQSEDNWSKIGTKRKLGRKCTVYQHQTEPLTTWIDDQSGIAIWTEIYDVFICHVSGIVKHDNGCFIKTVILKNEQRNERIKLDFTEENQPTLTIKKGISSKLSPSYGQLFNVVPGLGLHGFAELDAPLQTVIDNAKKNGFKIKREADEYDVQTIILPKHGIYIYGNHKGSVGAINCYIVPKWDYYSPFNGILDSTVIIEKNKTTKKDVIELYGCVPHVLLEGSESRKLRGESYFVKFPDGDEYYWFAKKGLGVGFDTHGYLVSLRIELNR